MTIHHNHSWVSNPPPSLALSLEPTVTAKSEVHLLKMVSLTNLMQNFDQFIYWHKAFLK